MAVGGEFLSVMLGLTLNLLLLFRNISLHARTEPGLDSHKKPSRSVPRVGTSSYFIVYYVNCDQKKIFLCVVTLNLACR